VRRFTATCGSCVGKTRTSALPDANFELRMGWAGRPAGLNWPQEAAEDGLADEDEGA